MKNLLLSFSILLFTSGCYHTVQYIGQSYPPTSNVEIFFSPVDVGKHYRIIGKVIGQATNLKKSQRRYLEAAKEKGADAIIIYVPGSEVNELPRSQVITSTHTPADASTVGQANIVTTIANVPAYTMYADLIKYK